MPITKLQLVRQTRKLRKGTGRQNLFWHLRNYIAQKHNVSLIKKCTNKQNGCWFVKIFLQMRTAKPINALDPTNAVLLPAKNTSRN
jgi:hypothetical protein